MKNEIGSLWVLRLDLLAVNLRVYVASMGEDSELRPETHMFLFDRYWRLVEYHRGREAKAKALYAKAEDHYRAGGEDGPPYAAAMRMPRPRPWPVTEAVSRSRLPPPDDAA